MKVEDLERLDDDEKARVCQWILRGAIKVEETNIRCKKCEWYVGYKCLLNNCRFKEKNRRACNI